MRIRKQIILCVVMAFVATALPSALSAQDRETKPKEEQAESKKQNKKRKKKEVVAIADFTQGFSVRSGGRINPVVRTPEQDSLEVAELSRLIDSLIVARNTIPAEDTTALRSMQLNIDSLTSRRVEIMPAVADTLPAVDSLTADTLPKQRYNWLFRDSLSFGLTTAASVVLPGFAQLYEEKYWKIPLEYAMVGLPAWGAFHQNKIYQGYKAEFDKMAASGASQEERTPVQTKMLKHKSYRTLFMGAAAASFMGFLVDGIVNFPSPDITDIQRATTLSLVCPGAGQVYNGSYWKVPIVVVGMASMVYVIDWNQRGYSRFKLAYDLATDGDDTTIGEFPNTSEESLRSIKNSYRRNRDLAIIGTVAVYLVQVADAHIDAHMQAYDISNNLSMKIEPQIIPTVGADGITYNYGMGMTVNF